ncbi:mechanosensitive ion channel family protein [Oceanirhabdus sp. W0125-5]|uniref:mechanosensitive ion channel family protein n=1 Tax=Oceanirhabdus sp. W0125-5 TaxID=2999116 RepID=UPI0022F31102|nr:mechanosensitive ion channel family protein [Oceanirhabdus sp. W0125-5]WBW97486.1 mechanosensitive ion channel family protein [Oceanirhabdus sp. W0125-5]
MDFNNITLQSVLDFFIKTIHIREIGLALGLFLILNFMRRVVVKKIYKRLMKHADKTKNDIDDKLFRSFEKPINILLSIASICGAILFFLQVTTSKETITELITYDLTIKVLRTAVLYCVTWGVYNVTKEKSVMFENLKERLGIKVDKILYPFIIKCLRVLLVIAALLQILPIWGINISTLITGVGLGGLAFSLAAKDFASNIIGGVALILEKPFNIGDWISADSIEGVVEDISFRSTRIRTFSQEMVIVPNSLLANTSITNYTKRGKRRISFNLGVTYDTPREKIKLCIEQIESMLREHNDIHQETIFVTFNEFSSSSLDIFLYFFTKTTNWGEHLKIKEDINFKLMKIFEDNGVSFAFPSTSIYIENTGNGVKETSIDKAIKAVAVDKE